MHSTFSTGGRPRFSLCPSTWQKAWIHHVAGIPRLGGHAKSSIRPAVAAEEDEPWAYLAQAMVVYATRDDALAVGARTQAVVVYPAKHAHYVWTGDGAAV